MCRIYLRMIHVSYISERDLRMNVVNVFLYVRERGAGAGGGGKGRRGWGRREGESP
jgi:hypothetical protein